jgi:16S rRNA (uracil1498-N3)-methyltransferase
MIKKLQKRRAKSGCRFYVPEALGSGAEVRLGAETAHHAVHTLRLGVGDAIVLFDGSGGEYEANICRIARNEVIARTGQFVAHDAEAPIEIFLGQGMSSGERMDFTVQKAAELGVAAIRPIETERSVVKLSPERAARKTAHWCKVAIAACEQCGRNRIVDLFEPQHISDWLGALSPGHTTSELRLLLSPEADMGLGDLPEHVTRIVLLAGPEGGLSEKEVHAARRRGFQAVRMGPRVLRTETAALAALAAIQLRWGDF